MFRLSYGGCDFNLDLGIFSLNDEIVNIIHGMLAGGPV